MGIKVILPINHTGLNLPTREEIAPAIAPDTRLDNIIKLTCQYCQVNNWLNFQQYSQTSPSPMIAT